MCNGDWSMCCNWSLPVSSFCLVDSDWCVIMICMASAKSVLKSLAVKWVQAPLHRSQTNELAGMVDGINIVRSKKQSLTRSKKCIWSRGDGGTHDSAGSSGEGRVIHFYIPHFVTLWPCECDGKRSLSERCLWMQPEAWLHPKQFPNQGQFIEDTCWPLLSPLTPVLLACGVWCCCHWLFYHAWFKPFLN